jgi:polyhydroxyalkanoate synthesis repressor PhaR
MPPVAFANADPLIIKKYANRRLYDTNKSRYITLEDLAQMIREGTVVQVVDANRGTDLTRQVLTQVILEEQDRLDMIPVELLHHIIKVQGTMLQGPFASFLSMAMKQFNATGSLFQRQVDAMFDTWPGQRTEPAADPEPSKDAESSPASGEEPAVGGKRGEDMGDLRGRMDALLERLGKKR